MFNSIKKTLIQLFYIVRYINYPQRTALVPDTFKARYAFAKIDRFVHWIEYRLRTKLIKGSIGANIINKDMGYGRSKHSQKDAVAYISSYARSVDWSENKHGKKKPFLQSVNLEYGVIEELDRLITSPEIVGPIANYLGVFPIFNAASIFYSPNIYDYPGVSQNAHLDAEDIKQIKCWIPLEDITDDSGPLHILPANTSRMIYEKMLKHKKISARNQKVEDSLISQYINDSEWIKCTGNVDEVFFTDTCQCYHFGSRKALKPRMVLMLHYFTPGSMEVPFFMRKKKRHKEKELTYLLGYRDQLFTHKYRRK